MARLEPLRGKQREAARGCVARINIFEGSVRSGKTVSSLLAWLRFVREGPPGNLLMAGKTQRTLKRNVIDPLVEWLGTSRCRYVQGSGEVWLLGRRVYIAGANDERAQDKIRGLTLAGAYGDEITTWPQSFFTMLLSRLSIPGAGCTGATNPDNPYHWLKREYLDRAGELDLRTWSFRIEDNPHLDPAYIEALKHEYTGLWYQRFIEGRWVQAQGAVYDMWDPEKHTISRAELPKRWDRLNVGVDYGTGNPTVFLLVGEYRGKLYVIREYYHDGREKGQKSPAQHSRDFREWIGNTPYQWVVVDPAAAAFIAQLRQDGVTRIRHADNDVLPGIQEIASRLSNGTLWVCREDCPNLIREFASYVWDENAQKRGEDRPVKEHDHALDALRYVVRTLHRTRPTVGAVAKPAGY